MGERRNSLEGRFDRARQRGIWLMPLDDAERLALTRGCASGTFVSPYRGMFVRKWDYEQMWARERALTTIRSLAWLHPDWVFCSYSAALLHGLQVPNAMLSRVHIAKHRSNRSKSPVIFHRVPVDDDQVVTVMGVRATDLRRTIVDCLCESDLRAGLAVADSALHWGLAAKEEIGRWLECDGHGRKGIVRARRTLAYADGKSENGGESTVRAIIIELGFAVPVLQVPITDPLEPQNPKYGDMGWRRRDGRWVILELDGMDKYRTNGREDISGALEKLTAERRREAHINLTDTVVVRVSFREALDTVYLQKLLLTAGVPKRSRSRKSMCQ